MGNQLVYEAIARVMMHGYMRGDGMVVDVAPNGQTVVERDASGGLSVLEWPPGGHPEPIKLFVGDPLEPPWQESGKSYRIAMAYPGKVA